MVPKVTTIFLFLFAFNYFIHVKSDIIFVKNFVNEKSERRFNAITHNYWCISIINVLPPILYISKMSNVCDAWVKVMSRSNIGGKVFILRLYLILIDAKLYFIINTNS